MAEDEVTETGGISRRGILKKGAIAGGALVWAAPAVQSMTSAAFAVDSPGARSCCSCHDNANPLVNDVCAQDGPPGSPGNFPQNASNAACDAFCTAAGFASHQFNSSPTAHCNATDFCVA